VIASAPSVSADPAKDNPDNPAYIQIKAQRESNAAQRASLETKRAEVQTKIAELEAHLAAEPAVERDFSALVRELDSEQIKYREVRQKQMSAKLAENLEDEQKGERFTLIDPPLAPEEPQSPNRWLLAWVGLMLAIGGAIGAVILLESSDHSVRNRRDLEALVKVPPLAILPRINTLQDLATRRRSRRIAMYGAASSVLAVLLLTHLFYRPLDVLWAVAVRKLGG
jgi:hypothetical protein